MKLELIFLLVSLLVSTFQVSNAQNGRLENDTLRLNEYCNLALDYAETNRDSSIYYGSQALKIARKLKQTFYEASILCDLGYAQLSNGDYNNALNNLILASKLVEDKDIGRHILPTPYIQMFTNKDRPDENRAMLMVYIKNSLALLYGKTRNPQKQLETLFEARNLVKSGTNDQRQLFTIYINMISACLELNKLDSAFVFINRVIEIDKNIDSKNYKGVSLTVLGDIYQKKGNIDSAYKYYFDGLKILKQKGENVTFIASTLLGLSKIHKLKGQTDSSLFYAKEAIRQYQFLGTSVPEMSDAYYALSGCFSNKNQHDSAFFYLQLSKQLDDSLHEKEIEDLARFQNLGFKELMRLKEKENQMQTLKSQREFMVLLGGLISALIISLFLYRINQQRQKANVALQSTISNLKSTQAQLIQSEKMASLGELTAGIAHEIQNPLNFVNNFSELNSELIEELKEELEKGNVDEAKNLAADIDENEQKILHHGKRADAIVKGMLQHSRSSSGKKEPTDINALADEYLRLAYHGLRAKDKSFNAKMETDFDGSIGKISVIPQDIGRVILNLITNAFYVVDEKKKSGQANYDPLVLVSTKKLGDKIEIIVKDNGNGIPEKVLDKIFQPFFTTKPTGQGTGLGLSLSYDIVKAHSGELKVETKDGEGSEFIIQLSNL